MISTPDRENAAELIRNALISGAGKGNTCRELGISPRTYQRWTSGEHIKPDGRPQAKRPAPANRLSEGERAEILAVCNQPEHRDRAASQIVPHLADQGSYLASESSFRRVLM